MRKKIDFIEIKSDKIDGMGKLSKHTLPLTIKTNKCHIMGY